MSDTSKGYAHPELLVTAAELSHEIAEAPDRLLLLDVRPAHQFAAGHLPHAVHLESVRPQPHDSDPAPLKSFLWVIEHLLAEPRCQRRSPCGGVRRDVGYPRRARVLVSRVLRAPRVRVLDGGARAWRPPGSPCRTDAVAPTATEWTGTRRTELLATWKDVSDRLGRADTAILDTRSRRRVLRDARFARRAAASFLARCTSNGRATWGRTARSSRPRSCAPCTSRRASRADREVVPYCQGGYRAAHSYLALRLLGYPRLRNYLASWREWGDRLSCPSNIRR